MIFFFPNIRAGLKIGSLCSLQTLVLLLAFKCTSAQQLPEMYVSKLQAYDIEEGLPMSPIYNSVIDQNGRLWLCPSPTHELLWEKKIFHFDGYHAYFPEFILKDTVSPDLQHLLADQLSDGQLVGWVVKTGSVFKFNPDTHHLDYFSLPPHLKIQELKVNEAGSIFIWVKQKITALQTAPNKETRELYRLDGNHMERLSSIEYSTNQLLSAYQQKHLLSSGNHLWYSDQISYDPTKIQNHYSFHIYHYGEENRQYDLSEQIEQLFPKVPDTVDQDLFYSWTLDSAQHPLFYFNALNEFYVFDQESGKLQPHQLLNEMIARQFQSDEEIVFNRDQSGNIIIHSRTLPGRPLRKAFLLDRNEQLFSYRAVLAAIHKASRYENAAINNISGIDFKRQLNLATDGGLVLVDIGEPQLISSIARNLSGRAMVEIRDNQLLLLNDRISMVGGKGLYFVDLKNKNLQEVRQEDFCDLNLFPFWFTQFHKDQQGRIYIQTDSLLMRHDPVSNTCESFPVGFYFEKFALLPDNKVALINMYGGDVYLLNLLNQELAPLSVDGKPLKIPGIINQFFTSRDSLLWVASLSGLWKIDYRKGSYRLMDHPPELANHQIMCIHEDKRNRLWLGTFSKGIQIYDPAKVTLKSIDVGSGLSNNTVVGILEDKEGFKWASTYSGLNLISPEDKVLGRMSEEVGISNREFNRFSYLKTADGHLIFGTVDGINVLDPVKLKARLLDPDPPKIFINQLSYYDPATDKEKEFKYGVARPNAIVLPPAHRYLKIRYALSSYLLREENRYAYKIEGLNEDWVDVGSNIDLTLNNLPIGKYQILIKGINYKGAEVLQPAAITLRVKAFFYEQVWFYLFCALFIIGIALFWIRRLRMEKIRLEEEVRKRTAKIASQTEELKELDKMKSRFFTNISHEFRTPLTIINGMAEQIHEDPDQWAENGSVMIQRNGENLLDLVNQILDLRKLEAGKLQLQPIQGDVISYLSYICESFTSLASRKNLELRFHADQKELIMDYDPEKLLRVISNLLVNAIKFTEEGGNIDVFINESSASLAIKITDTGIGIPPEKLPHIFDRFYQVDNPAMRTVGGTGIGLPIVRELIKLMNGSIKVVSQEDQGTEFKVLLPITRNAPPSDQEVVLTPLPPSSLNLPEPILDQPHTLQEDERPPTINS